MVASDQDFLFNKQLSFSETFLDVSSTIVHNYKDYFSEHTKLMRQFNSCMHLLVAAMS